MKLGLTQTNLKSLVPPIFCAPIAPNPSTLMHTHATHGYMDKEDPKIPVVSPYLCLGASREETFQRPLANYLKEPCTLQFQKWVKTFR